MSKRAAATDTLDTSPPLGRLLAGTRLDGEGSLTRQVYRLVRGLIVRLVLAPNQFLSEKDVAACLDISKTPVREAFIRLAEDGIVVIVPKSGTYVSPIDVDRAMEGFFIWSALESSCAAQAARLCGIDDIARLRGLLADGAEFVRDGDAAGFVGNCDLFHDLIMRMADLTDSGKILESARFEVDRVMELCAGRRVMLLPAAQQDLTDLVNALALHDAEAARAAMGRHIDRLRDTVADCAGGAAFGERCAALNRKRPKARRKK